MAEVLWSERASRNLDEIKTYIEQFDPIAAGGVRDRLIALGNSLAYAPQRGRPGSRVSRELVSVHPYILTYRIVGDAVLIVRVRHSRRHPLR